MEFLPFFTRPPLSSIRRWQLGWDERNRPIENFFVRLPELIRKMKPTILSNELSVRYFMHSKSSSSPPPLFFFIHMEYYAFALSWWRLDKVPSIMVQRMVVIWFSSNLCRIVLTCFKCGEETKRCRLTRLNDKVSRISLSDKFDRWKNASSEHLIIKLSTNSEGRGVAAKLEILSKSHRICCSTPETTGAVRNRITRCRMYVSLSCKRKEECIGAID